ncbi:unnamed protein product, partial [Heterotrigona itama]
EIGANIDRIKLIEPSIFEDDRCRKRRDNNTPYQNASRITGEQVTDIESIWCIPPIYTSVAAGAQYRGLYHSAATAHAQNLGAVHSLIGKSPANHHQSLS